MLSIKNEQPEAIRITYNGKSIIINGNEVGSIPDINSVIITIERCDFSNEHITYANKVLGTLAKSSILIIDSMYCLENIEKDSLIVVRNGIYEHSTGDFGYLYFDVIASNCRCFFSGCKAVNRKEVLRMQKVIRFGEFYDFPPFSSICALWKYAKIKKMCSQNRISSFLKEKKENTVEGSVYN